MRKKAIICFILFLCAFGVLNAYKNQSKISKVAYALSGTSSEIVMEVGTGRVLFEQNACEKKYMASTTKIITALAVIENTNMSDIITVSKQTVGVEGSSIYLEEGEKLSVKDLLYGLMLRSGNDCAETLAVHCSGTIEKFAKLMNETARKIGAVNSNFVNPHGLHDDNHYTTAYDLALITSYAMKNQIFREIVGTKSVTIPFTTRDFDRHLVNKNKILTTLEGATGVKTGFTKKAGRCLVSSCKRNGMEVVCVVLNCAPMFERSTLLIENAFNEYKPYKIIESDNIFDFVNIENSKEKCGVYVKNDVTLPLKESEIKNIKIVDDYRKILKKPIKKDTEIGSVKIYCQNNLLFEEKIYTIVDIK
ncbi:MAG: D-alanyl-D-alanine carboxypeptidase [Clostridiales bacterium]|nr:D-alanyl-D-alanine carboxypeptidase [Clostridiales bacterium]